MRSEGLGDGTTDEAANEETTAREMEGGTRRRNGDEMTRREKGDGRWDEREKMREMR